MHCVEDIGGFLLILKVVLGSCLKSVMWGNSYRINLGPSKLYYFVARPVEEKRSCGSIGANSSSRKSKFSIEGEHFLAVSGERELFLDNIGRFRVDNNFVSPSSKFILLFTFSDCYFFLNYSTVLMCCFFT